ncbi:unnamed protein product [Durusdinium trenchii]|uniref:Uncharacterized protein n=2 Tax=Durusdinium trenchii TaxID=1381693 RepID=A0ABP0HJA6_9DINO
MVLLMLCGVGLLGVAVGVPWYYGLLSKTILIEKMMEPAVFMFTKHVGPYANVGQVFDKLSPVMPPKAKMAMMSLDNPQVVESSKLRALLGFWMPATPEAEKLLKEISSATGLPMSKREMKAGRVKVTAFPLRGPMSFMLGPMKIYPTAFASFDPSAPCCGSMEIYHHEGDNKIEYIFSMENPEDYAWPAD